MAEVAAETSHLTMTQRMVDQAVVPIHQRRTTTEKALQVHHVKAMTAD